MGVYSPSSSGPAELPPPPPSNDPRWQERDRFGLAVLPPTLLAESAEERRARIATIERLVTDLFKTTTTHLGRPEARRLFNEVTKAPWTKGKQPNRDQNDQLLDKYYNAVRQEPDRIKSIPRLLAQQRHPTNPRSVPQQNRELFWRNRDS